MSGFDLNQINDLDINNIGSWPVVAKIVVILFVCALVGGGGYWFLIKDSIEALQQVEQKEASLKTTFETKQAKAANLDAYRQQMKIMEVSFGELLKQLPKTTEVPGLIEELSQVGNSIGLTFDQIKLDAERAADFYFELPINIQVRGNYHQFGAFVSQVAKLPRIITLNDYTIIQDKTSGSLKMEIQAKTYRYQGEAE